MKYLQQNKSLAKFSLSKIFAKTYQVRFYDTVKISAAWAPSWPKRSSYTLEGLHFSMHLYMNLNVAELIAVHFLACNTSTGSKSSFPPEMKRVKNSQFNETETGISVELNLPDVLFSLQLKRTRCTKSVTCDRSWKRLAVLNTQVSLDVLRLLLDINKDPLGDGWKVQVLWCASTALCVRMTS